MSYSQNKDEINKVFQINSLNSRGRFFLRTEDYERAKECFSGVLEIDEGNIEALTSLFRIEHGYRSVEDTIDYYRNLYRSEESETLQACEYETALIEEYKDNYYIENYLNREEIGRLFDYDEDITFESKLSACEKQKEQIENEIKNSDYLSKLAKSEDPQAKEIIEKILEPYNTRLEEARNADQYARIKIATNYRRFIEKQGEEVKELAKKAQERKENDYNGAIELYYQAEDIVDFERAIEIFKTFEGYRDAEEYIKNCQTKIEDIRSRLKAIENQNRVRENLNKAEECLKRGEFEKADELYFEVISIDSDNPEGYLGTLLAENEVSGKEELFNVFFKTDYTPVKIKAISESSETVEKYVEKYYLPNYLEKEEIREFFAYSDLYYDSYLESATEKKEELKKEFEHNQTISWLMDHDESFITSLYRELNEKYDQQIEEFRKKDELEAVNKTVKYQRFLKNSTREIKQKYDNALKKKEEDYQNARDVLHTAKSVKEVKEVKRTLNNLGDYKDSKDLLFEALNKIEELKIEEKEAQFRKELEGYIEEAKDHLKKDKFEDADLLFQKVYSFDDENVEARIGLLMVENSCHDIDELIDYYKELYSIEQFKDNCETINGKVLIDGHIQAMADKYSIPGRLERNVIVNLYNNEEISYKSTVSKLEELQETLNDDISIDENLTWLCAHENNQISIFFKELSEDLEKAIKEAKKEDIANQNRIKEEFKNYAKQIDEAVIDLYKRIKKPEGDEEVEEEVEEWPEEEEPVTLDELASAHNLNLEVEPFEIPEIEPEQEESKEKKKLKFNVLDMFTKLKENKRQEEERKLAEEQERIRTEEALRAKIVHEIEEERKANEDSLFRQQIESIKSSIEELKNKEESKKKEEPKQEKQVYTETRPFVIQRPKPMPTMAKPEPEYVPEETLAIKEPEKEFESEPQVIEPEKDIETKEKTKKIKKKKETVPGEPGSNKLIFVMVAVMVLLSALIINIVYRTIIKPNNLYKEALELVETQQYNKAIEIFEQLGDYKDSAQLVTDTYYKKAMSLYEKDNPVGALEVLRDMNTEEAKTKAEEIKKKLMTEAGIGDIVVFGEYEQDGDATNGREYIEWTVLDIDGNKKLIISNYLIESLSYSRSNSDEKTWEESYVRFWLNGRFPDNAFNNEDPSIISSVTLESIMIEDGYEEKYETEDNIFLLSDEEARYYFPEAKDRQCKASQHLINSGLFVSDNGYGNWWLRSPQNINDSQAAYVWNQNGEIANSITELANGIRPVMWVEIK